MSTYKFNNKLEYFDCECINDCIISHEKNPSGSFNKIYGYYEYLKGKIYHGNMSQIMGMKIIRVFTISEFPICREFTPEFFKKHFNLIKKGKK